MIRCSCKLSDHPEGNIDLLKREIIRSALDEAFRVKETPSWQNVLQAIQRANKDYLTFDEFSEVCDSCGILEQEDILETLDWLNSLGVIVSYKGAPLCRAESGMDHGLFKFHLSVGDAKQL